VIEPSWIQAGVGVVSLLLGYIGYVARKLHGWIDEQENRTRQNETRSHVNRRVLEEETERDVSDLPPADDHAEARLGPIPDGGSER
jgi:hypothetical protein